MSFNIHVIISKRHQIWKRPRKGARFTIHTEYNVFSNILNRKFSYIHKIISFSFQIVLHLKWWINFEKNKSSKIYMAASYVILNEYNLCTFKGRTFLPGGKSQVRAYFIKVWKHPGFAGYLLSSTLPIFIHRIQMNAQEINSQKWSQFDYLTVLNVYIMHSYTKMIFTSKSVSVEIFLWTKINSI